MAINPKTHGLHHIALRCSDFSTTKKFYNEILGLPLVRDTEDIIGFMAGSVFVGFKKLNP